MRFIPWLYDIVMGAAEHTRLSQWRRDVVGPARGRVLEIGAGTGLDFRFYEPGTVVIATDVDPHMLQRARGRVSESSGSIMLVAADAEALPFRSDAFDEGVIGLALCTIPQPDAALTELRRVLHPGGVLRLLEHVRLAPPLTGRLQDWLTPLWQRVAGGCRLNRRTAESVASHGFHVEVIHTHARGLFVAITARSPGAPSPLVAPDPSQSTQGRFSR